MKLQRLLLLQGGSSEEQLSLCQSEFHKSVSDTAVQRQNYKVPVFGVGPQRCPRRDPRSSPLHPHLPQPGQLSLWAAQHPGQLFVHQSPSHGLIAR